MFVKKNLSRVIITYFSTITNKLIWFIKFIQVQQGFDVADNEIVQSCIAGDIVITGDIPLASEVIDKAVIALNPRGELYTIENIKTRLNIRDFMDTMRASGIESGGPPPLNQKDRQQFANNLDKLLNEHRA